MRYLPFRSLDFNFPLASWWDEDEGWPELKQTSGLNVYEKDGEVFVEAAVPGIEPQKVKVTYEDGVLRISGKMEEKEEEKKKGKLVHQWSKVSCFDYTSVLPRPIDTKTIEAKVKNGVLTFKAKVAEEAKPKEIEIKVE